MLVMDTVPAHLLPLAFTGSTTNVIKNSMIMAWLEVTLSDFLKT